MTYTYKTIEKDGEKLVEKAGITAEFTIQEVYDHMDVLKGVLKEIDAKFLIENAKQENIKRNHEIVDTLTEEQRFAVYMYVQSQRDLLPYEEKKEEVETQMKEYQEELDVMKEQVPEAFETATESQEEKVESPMQPLDDLELKDEEEASAAE